MRYVVDQQTDLPEEQKDEIFTSLLKSMSKWSDKYKKSIDCDNPKGFSQKAHCAGKKKTFKE